MKSINKIVAYLFVVCMAVAFTACTEEAKYIPADDPSNAQVYFSNPVSQVDLTFDETSFDIELRRIDTSDALTVDLSATTESPEIFTFPTTSVSFATGEEIAYLTISYDPDQLEYDGFKSIVLTITNEELTTPYGKAVYEFEAGVPAPWLSLGTAIFSDLFMFDNSYEVELQQNMIETNRYRLVDPYTEGLEAEGYVPEYNKGNQSPYFEFTILPAGSVLVGVTTTVDGLVTYSDVATGYFSTNYQDEVYVLHPSRFNGYDDESLWLYNRVKQYSSTGEPEVVQMAPFYYMPNYGGGWNYSQYDDIITIIFPGVVLADYDVDIVYAGRYTDTDDEDYAIARVTLGEDIASAKIALVEGRDADAAIAAVEAGSLESMEITASGSVSIACTETGTYTFVVLGYGNDGEVKNTASYTFKFTSSKDNAETWTSLGYATYTDDFVSTFYGIFEVPYQVEIQESDLTPGLFRLVNPYGEAYPYNEPGDWDESRDYYIEINAVDPDGVYIETQDTGMDWGYGNFYVSSLAGYYISRGYSVEDVKAFGYCGIYADGVITFPKETLLVAMAGYEGGGLFPANNNNWFKVVMPGVTAGSATYNSAKATSRVNSRNLKNATPAKLKFMKKNVESSFSVR